MTAYRGVEAILDDRLARFRERRTQEWEEDEKLLLDRAVRLHPDDGELQKRAAANVFPSRFRK